MCQCFGTFKVGGWSGVATLKVYNTGINEGNVYFVFYLIQLITNLNLLTCALTCTGMRMPLKMKMEKYIIYLTCCHFSLSWESIILSPESTSELVQI